MGRLVARILARSWRATTTPFDVSGLEDSQLEGAVRILNSSGSGALALNSLDAKAPITEELRTRMRNLHRYYAITNAVHEQSLIAAFALLREHGIEALLLKGWAIGRMYPDSSRRPFGDIDICVKPHQFEAAETAFKAAAITGADIDLHSGFSKFYEVIDEDIWERSRLVDLKGAQIRVPAEEDHFRHVCLHFLRHGGKRTIWACDICVAIEMRSVDFDWQLALGSSELQRHWVGIAVGIAAGLLDCDTTGISPEIRLDTLPQWVRDTVLRAWGRPFHFPPPLSSAAGSLSALLREIPKHWPNKIEATVNFNRSFGSKPRFIVQLTDVASKGARVIAQTRGLVKVPK